MVNPFDDPSESNGAASSRAVSDQSPVSHGSHQAVAPVDEEIKIQVVHRTPTHVSSWISAPRDGFRVLNAVSNMTHDHVSTLAVDAISIETNGTSSPPHVLNDYLSTMVLTSDEACRRLVPHFQCDCDRFCPRCTVDLLVNVTNTSQTVLDVRYADIRVVGDAASWVSIVSPETVWCRLPLSHRVHIRMHAQLGQGSRHQKWSPVSRGGFRYKFKVGIHDWVNTSPLVTNAHRQRLVEACPHRVFALSSPTTPTGPPSSICVPQPSVAPTRRVGPAPMPSETSRSTPSLHGLPSSPLRRLVVENSNQCFGCAATCRSALEEMVPIPRDLTTAALLSVVPTSNYEFHVYPLQSRSVDGILSDSFDTLSDRLAALAEAFIVEAPSPLIQLLREALPDCPLSMLARIVSCLDS